MQRARSSARGARRVGTASVEFAVLITLLVPLLLGVWEVGRLVEVQQFLTNAAREGGRQASTGVKNADAVKQDVVNYLTHNNIKATVSDVTVENLTSPGTDPKNATQLDRFRITVKIPFDNVRWILLNQITPLTELSAVVEWHSMRDIPIDVNNNIPLY
jgi:Flp pilus assembly protein TadG